MKNATNIIELRNRMINALVEQGKRDYGIDSKTFQNPNFKINIEKHVTMILINAVSVNN